MCTFLGPEIEVPGLEVPGYTLGTARKEKYGGKIPFFVFFRFFQPQKRLFRGRVQGRRWAGSRRPEKFRQPKPSKKVRLEPLTETLLVFKKKTIYFFIFTLNKIPSLWIVL